MSAFINEEVFKVLARTAGGGARIRPEIMTIARHSPNFRGLSVAPAPSELGSTLKPFSSFCWGVPDNDLCARGTSKILSIYFPQYKTSQNWDPTLLLNINAELLQKLSSSYVNTTQDHILDNMLFYLLSILKSNYYLEGFSETLFGVAGEAIPPICFPKDVQIFNALSDYGRHIANMETESGRANLEGIGNISTTRETFKFTSFKVKSIDSKIVLFEDTAEVVSICDLTPEVLAYEVAGYNVIETYLKFNKSFYTNTNTDRSQVQEIRKVLHGIKEVIDTTLQIDLIFEELSENDLIQLAP
jgi:hypothetical protein